MRTIIAGSRDIIDPLELEYAISRCGWTITTIISGGARGADRLGESYARIHGIPLEIYEAEWDIYGPQIAGFIRNKKMAEVADALIALWDGVSNGTGNMIDTARKKKLKTYVHFV